MDFQTNKKINNYLFLVLLSLLITGIFQSCVWNNQEDLNSINQACDTIDVKYSTHVIPILQLKCYVCHNSGNSVNEIILDNYTDLKNSVNSGQFWGAINHETGFNPMPKNQMKMNDCRVTVIRKWIEDGSPNN